MTDDHNAWGDEIEQERMRILASEARSMSASVLDLVYQLEQHEEDRASYLAWGAAWALARIRVSGVGESFAPYDYQLLWGVISTPLAQLETARRHVASEEAQEAIEREQASVAELARRVYAASTVDEEEKERWEDVEVEETGEGG